MKPLQFVGIDLAWKARYQTSVCILDEKGSVIGRNSMLFSDEEIVKYISDSTKSDLVICIDAPIIVNNENGCRECEKQIMRDRNESNINVSIFCSSRSYLKKYFTRVRGEEITKKLLQDSKDSGKKIEVYETYPYLSIVNLIGKKIVYKKKRSRKKDYYVKVSNLLDLLKKEDRLENVNFPCLPDCNSTITIKKIKTVEDGIDSTICAVTAYYISVDSNLISTFGSRNTGEIKTIKFSK